MTQSAQRAHDVKMTSYERPCDVMRSHEVDTTSLSHQMPSEARLSKESKVPVSILGPAHTFVDIDHEIISTASSPVVLLNRLGDLNLTSKSVDTLTDRTGMTISIIVDVE